MGTAPREHKFQSRQSPALIYSRVAGESVERNGGHWRGLRRAVLGLDLVGRHGAIPPPAIHVVHVQIDHVERGLRERNGSVDPVIPQAENLIGDGAVSGVPVPRLHEHAECKLHRFAHLGLRIGSAEDRAIDGRLHQPLRIADVQSVTGFRRDGKFKWRGGGIA